MLRWHNHQPMRVRKLQKSEGLQGKSDPLPNPYTTPGWTAVEGALKAPWQDASEIWQQRTMLDPAALARTQDIVYTCIDFISGAATEAPPMAGRRVEKGWEDNPDHPALDLLKRPNAEMGASELIYFMVAQLNLSGSAFIWKMRNKAGYVSEIWPVPWTWVTPVRDAQGKIHHYDLWQGERKKPLPLSPKDMAWLRLVDPTNPLGALGPLQAAMRNIQLDNERLDYQMELLVNNRTPGTVVKFDEEPSEEAKSEYRTTFSSGLGRGKRGKVSLLWGGGATVSQEAPLKDLDWGGLSSLTETRVSACFGLSPIIANFRSGGEGATYANYSAAEKVFYRRKMVRVWNMVGDFFTRALIEDEDETDGTELYCNTEDVIALKEDKNEESKRAVEVYQGGVATLNEARKIAGLEPIEGTEGESRLVSASMVETGAAGETPAPPPDTGAEANATP